MSDRTETLLSRALFELDDLRAEVIRLQSRNEVLEADKRRMDHLESEPMDKPYTLFRRNMLITRQTIDEALAEMKYA